MNEIDPNKYSKIINKNHKKERSKTEKYFIGLSIRCLIVVVFLVSISIIYKSNTQLKEKISHYFFEGNISFTQINKIYNKYLGGLLPIKKENNVTEVFNEKLNYRNLSVYYDGIKLTVGDSYLVPSLAEGMVVFLGDKENYGKTVIIESLEGIYYWYGNISSTSLKLYDYVEKGTLVGEVNKELYLLFSKGEEYLDYEEYLN